MIKKICAFIVVALLLLGSTTIFAANEVKDSLDKAGETVRNVVGGAENVVEKGGEAITSGVKDARNTMENGTSRATETDRDDGYTATRTATNGTFAGMSGTTWTWFILAIAALAIIGLVWYYAMQNNNEYRNNNND